MNYQKFVDRLSRMTALAEGWQKGESLPAIERDLMLEELRGLYDELLDFKGDSGLAERVGATIMADTATEPIFDDVLDIDALLGLSDVERDEPKQEEVAVEPEVEAVPEPEIEVAVEPEPEPEPLPEPEPEPEPMSEPEPIAEPEPTVAPKSNGGLFDMEDIPVRTRSSRKMISLYTSPFAAETKPKAEEPKVEPVAKQEPKAEPAIAPEPKVETKPEPKPVPTPTPAPAPVAQPTAEPVRLGDVLGGKTTTLAEKMADDSAPTAAFNRITDLRKAIGLNDKFLMIRDLFDGDAARYEDTITTLNEFDDLDECMIYIVENFVWNPDSEGAKLLVSLIERKLA
ncbi:MAG: hypothetical protein IKJ20_02535 [Alistipes sp.]|nr:hypothetical protein [Alistipes sp.]